MGKHRRQSVSNTLYLAMMDIAKTALAHADEAIFPDGTPNPISAGITWQDIETLNRC